MPLILLNHMLPAFQNLPAVYQTGGKEVNAYLYPQRLVLERHFVQRGSHAVDAHIAVDAESGGEDIGKISPECRHGSARP